MSADFRARSGPLCLILIDYTRPLDEVDALMAEHVAWLELGFAQGVFLVAGRQNPRVGGVVLCRGSADAVRAVAETDPFVTGGVAGISVIEFNTSFARPELAAWMSA